MKQRYTRGNFLWVLPEKTRVIFVPDKKGRFILGETPKQDKK